MMIMMIYWQLSGISILLPWDEKPTRNRGRKKKKNTHVPRNLARPSYGLCSTSWLNSSLGLTEAFKETSCSRILFISVEPVSLFLTNHWRIREHSWQVLIEMNDSSQLMRNVVEHKFHVFTMYYMLKMQKSSKIVAKQERANILFQNWNMVLIWVCDKVWPKSDSLCGIMRYFWLETSKTHQDFQWRFIRRIRSITREFAIFTMCATATWTLKE